MAIVIAGERSGSGKTTITLALLSALRSRNIPVQSFKVGPDYIDPMFHAYVTGRPCYNLDPVLTSEDYLPNCFSRHIQSVDVAVVEGVMGLFDGAADPPGYGSTAQVAKHLGLPIVLVVNCQSLSHSVAAMVHGYSSLDPTLKLAGVILNRVGSDRHLEILQTALEPLHLPVLGVFRRQDEMALPDRHLGLVPSNELPELAQRVDQLATLGERCFDWERLMPLLATGTPTCSTTDDRFLALTPNTAPVRLAVARDEAFSFYYAENLELLTALGAELLEWSPLHDRQLPEGAQGFYFGGGFPEMFAAGLAANGAVIAALRNAIGSGLPTYAECGGLMYLAEAIVDFEGQQHPMVGILPTTATMGKQLTLGYRSAIAQVETPLLLKGTRLRGHEFHRSSLTVASPQPLYGLRRGVPLSSAQTDWPLQEGWHGPNLQASYLHLHWGAQPELPQRWLERCRAIRSNGVMD